MKWLLSVSYICAINLVCLDRRILLEFNNKLIYVLISVNWINIWDPVAEEDRLLQADGATVFSASQRRGLLQGFPHQSSVLLLGQNRGEWDVQDTDQVRLLATWNIRSDTPVM